MPNVFLVLFGLSSAICFGSGDFTGEYITKKTNIFLVLLFSQIIGMLFLLLCIFTFNENLDSNSILPSLISGIFGSFGLLAFYKGLSMGNMGIIAPITAVITPIIPFLFSIFHLQYSYTQIIGVALALVSIWIVSSSKMQKKGSYYDIVLAIIAGICFGLFLLFINFASTKSYFYPILIARKVSLIIITFFITFYRIYEFPRKNTLFLMGLVGILDTSGHIFFILSSKAGRVDFASIILSMGPVITVLLAWKLLNEKLTKVQSFRIVLSVFAVILLSM